MFKVSRRVDYGLQLLIALASDPQGQPQSTASLAKKLEMPLPFTHQIAHTLMQNGFIKASPGPKGGLALNQSATQITVLQVVEALEGPISLNPCTSCSDQCAREEDCVSRFFWDDLQQRIVLSLAAATIANLTDPEELKLAIQSLPLAQ
ncbi:MAG: Rrf2 family transcriptional regulator [Chloroflexi bacterium]|jgi:Rrf2 family protein|nr:Rrf2 family transcriptional regulator [Anaerolineaceae bacterium]NMB87246.1 Rrf2 family transcriptional regulator [Chloroflexota bacterium]